MHKFYNFVKVKAKNVNISLKHFCLQSVNHLYISLKLNHISNVSSVYSVFHSRAHSTILFFYSIEIGTKLQLLPPWKWKTAFRFCLSVEFFQSRTILGRLLLLPPTAKTQELCPGALVNVRHVLPGHTICLNQFPGHVGRTLGDQKWLHLQHCVKNCQADFGHRTRPRRRLPQMGYLR